MTQILTKTGQIKAEGRVEGIEIGEAQGRTKDILSLMENEHVSAEHAMRMLNVPEGKKQFYLSEISRLQSK